MLKAARGLAGGGGGLGGLGGLPAMPFPEIGRGPDIAGRIPERARFGIRMERVPALAAEQLGLEPNTGIAVSQVSPGSVAEKAGLKVHDIILQFAGKPVTDNTEDFIAQVSAVKAGEKVDLVLMRKGKKVEVKGVELPAAQPPRPGPVAAPNRLPNLAPNPLPLMP
jgi:predicted metalloprotease with PDZ domain